MYPIRDRPHLSELMNEVCDFVNEAGEVTLEYVTASFPETDAGVLRVYLSRLAQRGEIKRVCRGIYATKES